MKIGFATDHNGIKEKEMLIEKLRSNNFDVIDYSTDNFATDDYPVFAGRICKAIQNGDITVGILMCGTGIGMSIAANKYKGIRCAKVSSAEEASLARLHNHANVIALSYKLDVETLYSYILSFIDTEYSEEERHVRRVNLIDNIEG